MNKRTKNIILLGAALSPFVLTISTVNAVKGLSTAPALFYDMEARAADWQVYADAQVTDPAEAREVADTLKPLQKSVCATAGLEEREGLVTGAAGKGAVSAALTSACLGVTSINETLTETALRGEDRKIRINDAVAQLLDIPEREHVGIFERQDMFRETLVGLNDDLSEGGAENLNAKVRAQVAILANSVTVLETKDGSLGAKQSHAARSLNAQLMRVEEIVTAFLDEQEVSPNITQPDDLLPSGEAIAQWWPRLLPQIAAAIGVDLAVLWMAAFLAVGRGSLRDMRLDFARQQPHTTS